MANGPFIGIEALTELGNQIMPEIALSAYIDRQQTFDKFGIKVIAGEEFQNVRYALRTKGHTTRRKKVGETINSEAGQMIERKLVTYIAWNRFTVNKDAYSELPRKVGEQIMYPNSELNLRVVLKDFAGDIFDNLFFGDHEGAVEALALYDGFWTYLKQDIKEGYVKPIHLSAAITRPTSVTDTLAWDLFVEFMDALDPALRRAPKLIIICNPTTAAAIYSAYGHSHGDHKEMGIATNGNYTVAEYPNVEIAFDDAVGVGCRLMATVPDNLEFGIDTLNPENGITIAQDASRDNNNFVIQPQQASGTRIYRVDPKSFAVTDAAMNFKALSGDYREVKLYVSSSDEEKGTVQVDGAAPDKAATFEPGKMVTLKAIPAEGKAFEKWSNGSTDAEITVIVGDQSEAFVAFFK